MDSSVDIFDTTKYSRHVHVVLKICLYFEESVQIIHTHVTPVWHGYAKINDGMKHRRYLSFQKDEDIILLNMVCADGESTINDETYNVEHWRKVFQDTEIYKH